MHASSSSTSSSKQAGGTQLSMDFYETNKGFLAQKLLRRWWYSIEWPKQDELGAPPPGYEHLDGFRGVFVSTRVSKSLYQDHVFWHIHSFSHDASSVFSRLSPCCRRILWV